MTTVVVGLVALALPVLVWASVTPTSAASAVKTAIREEFGSVAHRYVKCPRQQIINGKANCVSEFRVGNIWHGRYSRVDASGHVKNLFQRQWVRRYRTCHGSRSERRYAPGKLRSNDGACDYPMAGDVQYALDHGQHVRLAFVHGTGTRFYPTVFLYRCKQHGRRVTCHNALGDAFKYKE